MEKTARQAMPSLNSVHFLEMLKESSEFLSTEMYQGGTLTACYQTTS